MPVRLTAVLVLSLSTLLLTACSAGSCPEGQARDNDGECVSLWAGLGSEAEICGDQQDNDGDGFSDCEDQDCGADPACAGSSDDDDSAGDDDDSAGDDDDSAGDDDDDLTVELCDDGLDNDSDGYIDCEDQDCWAHPACPASGDDDDSAGDDDDSVSCTDADGDNWCAEDGDCDDSSAQVNPVAVEVCDSLDNNCNGSVDEDAVDVSTWHLDADADGYGAAHLSLEACAAPSGYVANSLDCDDLDGARFPGASEICDELDNNCDGTVDEGSAAPATWYADADSDGYGNLSAPTSACTAPPGYVADSSDCDDLNVAVIPGGTEVCDGADNNCDQSVDEGVTSTFYGDSDGDGYGDPGTPLSACFQPAGASANALDCDDGQPSAHPGGVEVCDGLDNDCDGAVDDDALNATTWYVDGDGDGFGNPLLSSVSCGTVAGSVTNDLDCDDADSGNLPGGTEACDGLDNDCDGNADDGFDQDNDGVTICGFDGTPGTADDDCDDSDQDNFPGNTETCDGRDQNCDTVIDEGLDQDGDGVTTCGPDGIPGTADDDCDDTEQANFPGNSEVCDGDDNDCDTLVDEDIGGSAPTCAAGDCKAIYDTGERTDGTYWIDANGAGSAFQVACDMTNDGGGWTLVAKTDGNGDSHLSNTDFNVSELATTLVNNRATLGNNRRNALGPFYRFECSNSSFIRWAYQFQASSALDHWTGTNPVGWTSSYSTNPSSYTESNAQDCGSPTCDGPAYSGRNWRRVSNGGCGLSGGYGHNGLWWAK